MIVPIRIATNVPISTRPLPPTSSDDLRCCGRYAYLTGPNTVEWTPIRNVQTYSSGALCSMKPAPPTSITAISKVLTRRVSVALSYLSATWPEVAENSTNGTMKIAEMRNAAVFGSTPEKRAAWNVTSDVKPTLNTLSFIAPRNCVQKNGAKRRSRNRRNWLSPSCAGAAGRTARGGKRAVTHGLLELIAEGGMSDQKERAKKKRAMRGALFIAHVLRCGVLSVFLSVVRMRTEARISALLPAAPASRGYRPSACDSRNPAPRPPLSPRRRTRSRPSACGFP